ncbi:MAG: site-specific integrase [Oscillospiraceae bacterium]|nr:site-specific integrase [Oscillospiraceae bacterium]
MVAGHLQEKNGYYYIVLSYRDPVSKKRKQPWFATGLTVRGNKRAAEKLLAEKRRSFVPPKERKPGELGPDMLFADYMIAWLAIAKSNTAVTTYNGYVEHVHKHIAPWFRERGITLGELQGRHIQSYYLYRLEQVSGSSVRREHANIHRALKHAVMMDLIPFNPTDKTQPPKNNDYEAKYYNAQQLEALFEATKTHKLGLLFQMVAFYGMRRGEALGLRWDAIDFERNVFTIRHTVTECKIDGKQTLVQQDRAKNRSSRRTMPLATGFKTQLMALKARQEENRKLAGNSYNPEFIGYVFVDELGNLFRPSYVSSTFRALLEKNGLPRIRFHDLRHSCATLLVQSGIPINTVSDWVGHSDVTTTLKFYAHLDDRAKLIPAHQMETALNLPECTLPRPWE